MNKKNYFLSLSLFFILGILKAQVVNYSDYKIEELNETECQYIIKAVGLGINQIQQVKELNYKRLMEISHIKSQKEKEIITQKYFRQIEALLNETQKMNWIYVKDELYKME